MVLNILKPVTAIACVLFAQWENESRKSANVGLAQFLQLQASSDPAIVAVRYVYSMFAFKMYFYNNKNTHFPSNGPVHLLLMVNLKMRW